MQLWLWYSVGLLFCHRNRGTSVHLPGGQDEPRDGVSLVACRSPHGADPRRLGRTHVLRGAAVRGTDRVCLQKPIRCPKETNPLGR